MVAVRPFPFCLMACCVLLHGRHGQPGARAGSRPWVVVCASVRPSLLLLWFLSLCCCSTDFFFLYLDPPFFEIPVKTTKVLEIKLSKKPSPSPPCSCLFGLKSRLPGGLSVDSGRAATSQKWCVNESAPSLDQHHRPGSWNDGKSKVKQGQGASRVGFWRGLAFLLANSHRLAVSSRGIFSVHERETDRKGGALRGG